MVSSMSNVPLLYCLLYYRAGQQLKQAERSSYFQSPQESDSLFQPDGIRNHTILNTFSRSTHDPLWMYHDRRKDLNRLCYNVNGLTKEGADGNEYSSDVCYMRTLSDIGKIFPYGFTSEQDLHKIILLLNMAATAQRYASSSHIVARYAMNSQAQAALKTEAHGGMHCGVCLTEVGYEIITEVTDFNGQNHTVINLHNAYQFIPSGKCLEYVRTGCKVHDVEVCALPRSHSADTSGAIPGMPSDPISITGSLSVWKMLNTFDRSM